MWNRRQKIEHRNRMSENKKNKISSILTGFVIVVAIAAAVIAVVKFDATGRNKVKLPSDYVYSVDSAEAIAPELISCVQTGEQTATGFARSRAIALDADGRLYVAGDKGVNIFDTGGGLAESLSFDVEPAALCVDGGELYICMRNFVRVYDLQSGSFEDWQARGERSYFTSIAVDKDDVFVADAGGRIVLRYDKSGQLLNEIGKKDPERNIPGFSIPSPYFDLSVADDGLLRVVNPGRHRIEAYTYRGDLEFYWGSYSTQVEGFCGCCNPVNFAILDDGRFVTAEKGLTRIKIYDIDGNFENVVAGPEQLLNSDDGYKLSEFPEDAKKTLFDVAVFGNTIFVLDIAENRIMRFVPKQG